MLTLFIILVGLTMTLFSEKVLISNGCISGFMSNMIKKSWMDSIVHTMQFTKRVSPFIAGSLVCKRMFTYTGYSHIVAQHFYNLAFDPNWHEEVYFYLLVCFGSDLVSWFLIKDFQTFLEVKIDFNWVNLTSSQAH